MSKVTLRTKALKGNRIRLYLDFYPAIPHPDTGKPTRREFLKLFLYKPASKETERTHNKETKKIAEAIRAKRQLQVQAEEYDFLSRYSSDTDFLEWLKKKVQEREASGINYQSWRSTYLYLFRFAEGQLLLKKVDELFCEQFRAYFLRTHCLNSKRPLSNNSAASYFDVFKEAIRDAHKEGLLKKNPAEYVRSIPYRQTEREFLTLEELQIIARTKCDDPVLKKAALFSAFTGLRLGDLKNLHWRQVRDDQENGHYIRKQINKSQRFETLYISEQARSLLGQAKAEDQLVFPNLPPRTTMARLLDQWFERAGITRHIRFHAFRHTYATLQITFGTDIYTLKEMLGHKNVQTTQVYARIIDEKKKAAANVIPDIDIMSGPSSF